MRLLPRFQISSPTSIIWGFGRVTNPETGSLQSENAGIALGQYRAEFFSCFVP